MAIFVGSEEKAELKRKEIDKKSKFSSDTGVEVSEHSLRNKRSSLGIQLGSRECKIPKTEFNNTNDLSEECSSGSSHSSCQKDVKCRESLGPADDKANSLLSLIQDYDSCSSSSSSS